MMKRLVESSNVQKFGTDLVVQAQMAQGVVKPTSLRPSLIDIMRKLTTMRFNVVERELHQVEREAVRSQR